MAFIENNLVFNDELTLVCICTVVNVFGLLWYMKALLASQRKFW